jgi:hypothetical protein
VVLREDSGQLKSGRKMSNLKTEPLTGVTETRQKNLGLILIAIVMMMIIFCVVTPYDSVEVHRRYIIVNTQKITPLKIRMV